MPEAHTKAEPLERAEESSSRYPGRFIAGGATSWLLVLGLLGALACGDSETGTEPEPEPEEVREPTASACIEPPASLVAWWPAEGTAEDIIGPYDGTPTGGADYASGYVGQAFDLGGPGSYISLDEARSSGIFTIEGWLRPESARGREAIYGTFFAGLYLRDGRITWWQDDNAAGAPAAGVACMGLQRCDRFVGAGQLSDDEWQHVALTYDGSTFRGYVDGRLDRSAEFTDGRLVGTGSSPGIGLWARDDFPYWFTGRIDELSLYQRALSAAEIEAIWDAGSLGKCR